MADDISPRKHTLFQGTGFLGRLNALETVVLAFIALVALAGLMLIGKGAYLKATAKLGDGQPVATVAFHPQERAATSLTVR